MSDTLRLPERAPTGIGRSGAAGREAISSSGGHRLSAIGLAVVNLAGQVRFAFGEAEEKRIGDRVGFALWQCNAASDYIHTHPIVGETIAVSVLPAVCV